MKLPIPKKGAFKILSRCFPLINNERQISNSSTLFFPRLPYQPRKAFPKITPKTANPQTLIKIENKRLADKKNLVERKGATTDSVTTVTVTKSNHATTNSVTGAKPIFQVKKTASPYEMPPPPKSQKPFHLRQRESKPKKTKTNIIPPLPTTFINPSDTIKNWAKRPVLEPLLDHSEHHGLPYKYYEITLQRSLIGLDYKIKKIALSLGFTRRHQVVWRMVSPRSAGQILKLKELVSVRLVHQVAPKYPIMKGYKKLSSLIN